MNTERTCLFCGDMATHFSGSHAEWVCDVCAVDPCPPWNDIGNAAVSDHALRLLSFEQLKTVPEPEWLVDGIVPEGLAFLVGPPSTFKSFLALDLALCVATGMPWNGHEVKAGPIVYLSAEGHGGLRNRVTAWHDAHGQPVMDRARFLTRAVNLLDHEQVENVRDALAQLIGSTGAVPVLLVVDTMARTMVGGEENSARDVGTFIDALGRQPVDTTLVVHHTGKDGTTRGSSALTAAADMVAMVKRNSGRSTIEVRCHKDPKDGEPWDPITLRLEPVGASCVLRFIPPVPPQADADRRDAVLAYLAGQPLASRNEIERAIGGKAVYVRTTLDTLREEGVINETKQGNARRYSVARPDVRDEVGTSTGGAHPGEPAPEPRPTGAAPEGGAPGDEVEGHVAAEHLRPSHGSSSSPKLPKRASGILGNFAAETSRADGEDMRQTTEEVEAEATPRLLDQLTLGAIANAFPGSTWEPKR